MRTNRQSCHQILTTLKNPKFIHLLGGLPRYLFEIEEFYSKFFLSSNLIHVYSRWSLFKIEKMNFQTAFYEDVWACSIHKNYTYTLFSI